MANVRSFGWMVEIIRNCRVSIFVATLVLPILWSKKDITKMEEIFDKNGGFVWSDETY